MFATALLAPNTIVTGHQDQDQMAAALVGDPTYTQLSPEIWTKATRVFPIQCPTHASLPGTS